jgi:electron transfer flavoprotein beta subunit
VRSLGTYDLIVCGKQAIDGDTAQVGPGVAEMLDIPFVAWVRKIEEIADNSMRLERMMEEGYDVVEMPLPGLITVVKEINEPRLASLKGKMKARKAEINKIDHTMLEMDTARVGLTGSPTQVLRSFVPERKSGGEKMSGEVPDMVEKLKTTILDLGVIK